MRRRCFFEITLILTLILTITPVRAAQQSGSTQDNQGCEEYKQIIARQNETIENLTERMNYYENLSEYYKNLYMDQRVNLTNREIIKFNNNLTLINKNINDLSTRIKKVENNLTLFSLKIGLSILSLSLIEAFLFEKIIGKDSDEDTEEG